MGKDIIGLWCFAFIYCYIISGGVGLRGRDLREAVVCELSPWNRVRVQRIRHNCELEIYGILLTMDLRVMDMTKFDVILGMDWLTAHQVVIDCDRRRVTAYTRDGVCVIPQIIP